MANYTRNAIYNKLRSIDVSVETADALSEELARYSSKKVDAFILWAMGYTQKDAAELSGVHKKTLERTIIRLKCRLSSFSRPVKVRGE